MMKRQLAVFVAMAVAAGVCGGCGSSSKTESTPAENVSQAASSESETSGEEKETETTAKEKEEAKPERAKIKVAYHPHITGVGGILNAIDNGYFEEENLELELVQFTSGATELAAMASGDIDIGYLGVGAHVFAPQGQCTILALDSTDLSGEILVQADSGYKTMEDLRGKNVEIGRASCRERVWTWV